MSQKLVKTTQQHDDHVKRMVSAMYLLSTSFESYSDDLREYLKENNLKSDLANDFFNLKRSMAKVRKTILPMIGHENKMHLFEDYEKFIIQVDNFLQYKTTT